VRIDKRFADISKADARQIRVEADSALGPWGSKHFVIARSEKNQQPDSDDGDDRVVQNPVKTRLNNILQHVIDKPAHVLSPSIPLIRGTVIPNAPAIEKSKSQAQKFR
jgi:hypothetical protein